MSILNLAVQNVAFSRDECESEIEQILKSCNTMADIRKKAVRYPQIRQSWMNSVQSMRHILEERTTRLMLKGQYFQVHGSASDDAVKDFETTVTTLVPEVEIGKYQERFLGSKAGFKKFLQDHCRERSYIFQIQKCNDMNCCTPKRGHVDFPWVPDPMVKDDDKEHYQDLENLIGKGTTEKDKPSSLNTRVTDVAEQVQGIRNAGLVAQNVRETKTCYECSKPRCVYSKTKLSVRDLRCLYRILEKYDYTCGSEILPDGIDSLNVCVRMQLDCNSPIELAYYADNNTVQVNKTICCHCASQPAEKDGEVAKKYRVVLPICATCKRMGKEIIKRNPIK